MNNESLTVHDLALYLDQMCMTPDGIGTIACVGRENLLVAYGGKQSQIYLPKDVKPILFRLRDIAPDDALHIVGIVAGSRPESFTGESATEFLFENDEFYVEQIERAKGIPQCWQYLLKKGYDVFGWIDAGLAVDSVTNL